MTVLSLESLSKAAMINYMDAVATMRLGNGDDEKCMLYTDSMGRVFNVIISGGAEGDGYNKNVMQLVVTKM